MNTCHVCGVTAEQPHYRATERTFGWGDGFDYFQCLDCGCLQIAAPPHENAAGRGRSAAFYLKAAVRLRASVRS